jgi:Fe-S-cluster containining protein
VTDEEIRKIAEFRGEPVTQTRDLHTKIVGHRRSLRERSNGDCDFWDKEAGCTIYPVRPPQCRTWPFWVSNLETPDDWERTKRTCPGAGKGELISSEEITRRLKVIRI